MHRRLRALMEERGFTARALSIAAGLGPSSVWDILENKRDARLSSLEALAEVFGVDVSYLVTEATDVSPDEAALLNAMRQMSDEQRRLLRQMAEQLSAAPAPKNQP